MNKKMEDILIYYQKNKKDLKSYNIQNINELLYIIEKIDKNKQLQLYNYHEQILKIYDKIINIKNISEIDYLIECYDNLKIINVEPEKDSHINISLIYLNRLIEFINNYCVQKVFLEYKIQTYHISVIAKIYKLFIDLKTDDLYYVNWMNRNVFRIYNSKKFLVFYYDDHNEMFSSPNENIGCLKIDEFKKYLMKTLD